MAQKLFLLLLALYAFPALSQDKEQQQLLAEARLLYNSERASWGGTDVFLAKFPAKRDKLGGYFSYSEDKLHKCVFFDREPVPNVLATITFDDSFAAETAKTDSLLRKLTTYENDLYSIRKKALQETTTDTLFKHYKNTSLNLVPLIANGKKKVYILTGPSVNGVVIFGNDYLIAFDGKNNIRLKKALHKNIISVPYTDNAAETATMHSHTHPTGSLITATDICTLMLYSPYTHWEQHYVVSDKEVSAWDCRKEQLTVLTRKAWNRIRADKKGVIK